MNRFGIVGCGHIAKKHVEAIKSIEGAQLTAVCDTNKERLSLFAVDGVKGFTDLREMLNADVDIVCICTPSGLHRDLTIQSAKAKKHIIVEKPMALTLEDADAMIHACAENGVKLAVVHPNRFRPAVKLLHEQVKKNAFGKIGHANATVRWNRNQAYYDQAAWRGTKAMDGGVLMNQAIHNMDLLVWMMGEVEQVTSYEATRLRDIEAEDTSVSVIRFTNGSLGVLEAAVTTYPKNLEESLSIFGEKGTAIIGGPTANWIKHWAFEGLDEGEVERLQSEVSADPFGKSGHQCIIEDMIYAIKEGREPIVSGKEGRQALSLVVACNLSAEQGKAVYIDELTGGNT